MTQLSTPHSTNPVTQSPTPVLGATSPGVPNANVFPTPALTFDAWTALGIRHGRDSMPAAMYGDGSLRPTFGCEAPSTLTSLFYVRGNLHRAGGRRQRQSRLDLPPSDQYPSRGRWVWRPVHRHADPITTPQAAESVIGDLRATGRMC
jgi:hypothetical protein